MDAWRRLSELTRGRILILTAAVLWSTSGAFVKSIDLPAVTIAMYRSLAAGFALMLVAFLLRVPRTWAPLMAGMIAAFASMNYLFIAAMTLTTAANTIFLQYSAPLWMFLASVLLLREPMVRANLWAVVGGMLGIGVLIGGEWWAGHENRWGILFGLGSGITYASVAICLRALRTHNALWMAALNHLGAGLALLSILLLGSLWGADYAVHLWPSGGWSDISVLVIFGTCQMATPYVLFGMGLRYVSPQEVGVLTLIEPMLNPVWTYLAAGEQPSAFTMCGGGILLSMLVLRYLAPMLLGPKAAATPAS